MAGLVAKRIELPCYYERLSRSQKRSVRERYIELQEGLCFHCKSDLEAPPPKEILKMSLNLRRFPKGFLNYPVHLHHSHKTGLTLGAVHSYCNGVLWQYYGE